MMDKHPSVYIVANKRNGAIYVGVTSNLSLRISQHKSKQADGYSKTHGTDMLVWYEFHETMLSAIEREKQLKKWNRAWKISLIEKQNPYWNDLSETLIGP
jgi:putative endonuclease